MYLGLDLSLSGSGVVVIDSSYSIIHKELLSTPMKGVERLFFLEEKFVNSISKYIRDLKLVCIESPAYGVSEGNLFSLGQWGGIVELNLFKLGLKFIYASPTQLKKYVLGSGKGQKTLMLLKTFQQFNEEFDDDNICDAYSLSRIAHDYHFKYELNKDIKTKKYQLEVLKSIHKSLTEKDDGTVI